MSNKIMHLILLFLLSGLLYSKEINPEKLTFHFDKPTQVIIKSGYKVSSFPHYTLIDRDGNIISNFPKHPSEGLSEEIKKLLIVKD